MVKIPHLPAALRHCDRILRLEQGRLVAYAET
jgi:ABC-type multidrug transport system fused ATPase/permease subunit